MQRRSDFEQSILKYLSEQPSATPRCVHFGLCGGCRLQDYSYQDQLNAKQQAIKELFADVVPDEVLAAYKIEGSSKEYEYRVKMEYVLGPDKFGLRQLGQPWNIVNLTECHLIPAVVFAKVREFYTKHTAELSQILYLVVRSFESGIQLGFVTLKGKEFLAEPVAKLALAAGFKSVYHAQTNSPQIASGEIVETWGEEFMTISLAGYDYSVGAQSFTQNNLAGFTSIINYILPHIKPNQRVYDLYCGIGTITMPASKIASEIVGVEEVDESISLAKLNAAKSNVNNATFLTSRVADFLRDQTRVEFWDRKHGDASTRFATGNPHIDTIIVDPPRAGLNKKVTRRLQKYFNAETIIYISCNPFTQAQDLADLNEKYQVVDLKGFDLFPQTLHMENVAILKRI